MSNPRFSIGDKVVLIKATNASLNLYEKAKRAGMTYVRCPCSVKSTDVLTIMSSFATVGALLKKSNGVIVVAHFKDIRKVD